MDAIALAVFDEFDGLPLIQLEFTYISFLAIQWNI